MCKGRFGGFIRRVGQLLRPKTSEVTRSSINIYLRYPTIVLRMMVNAYEFARFRFNAIPAIRRVVSCRNDPQIRSEIIQAVTVDMVDHKSPDRFSHYNLMEPYHWSPLANHFKRAASITTRAISVKLPFKMSDRFKDIVVDYCRVVMCKLDYFHLHIIAPGGYLYV